VDHWLIIVLLALVAAMAAAALYAVVQARAAERKTPPIGRFIDIDGVRLHYIEQGHGDPVVLIHGNGTLIQDFTVSGLVDGPVRAPPGHRVRQARLRLQHTTT
jgi:hypothetical protein